jgi:hypothetical protein
MGVFGGSYHRAAMVPIGGMPGHLGAHYGAVTGAFGGPYHGVVMGIFGA